LSVTVSVNVRIVVTETPGAVKDATAVPAPDRAIDGPAVWVQAYNAIEPSGSLLAAPVIVTVAPDAEFWSAPALATGG
jgi:hypothetical protein